MKNSVFTFFSLLVMLICPFFVQAQEQATLQFTGKDQNGGYVQLSRVLVENVTKHWQEVLYYPDTTLLMGVTGVEDVNRLENGVRLLQNVPNPFDGVTEFALLLPEASKVLMEIYDMNGKVAASYSGTLEPGKHLFQAWMDAPQTYLLNAQVKNGSVQIKMVNTGHAGKNAIEYIGEGNAQNMELVPNNSKGATNQPFSFGDIMSYLGYTHLASTEFESIPVAQGQDSSELISLLFELPLPTVTTRPAINIYTTAAQLNGTVTEHPDYPVTERGFLFADNDQLTDAASYAAGSGGGDFQYTVSNLQVAHRYYFKAYALTAIGITYGNLLFFDTQAEMPVVHTDSVTEVKASQATCGGMVIYNGGEPVTAQGVCWSTSPNPSVSDNHTNDSSNTEAFTSHITGLAASTTYYVRAYATNIIGTAYGEQRSFTTQPPFFCGIDMVTDYDSNSYHTVEIGQQCWMKENLRTTHYADGTEILPGTTNSETVPYRYAPDGNILNVPLYGYLYNWAAVMNGATSSNANPSGVQGICPPGWHVPSKAEWEQLLLYVSSQSQYVCGSNDANIDKALAGTFGWARPEDEEPCSVSCYPLNNNATGFTALPAGSFDNNSPSNFNSYSNIYSSTHYTGYGNLSAYHLEISYVSPRILATLQQYAWSVRCLLDDAGVSDSIAVNPIVSTKAISYISPTSAYCGEMVTASGGTNVTVRGICWSTTPNPTLSDNHISDSSGLGGFTYNITGLSANTTYYVRAYATNCTGTSYGEQRSFTTLTPFACGTDSITDYDGNVYHTLQFGQQCWLKENLRTTHYADGTPILMGTEPSDTIAYLYGSNYVALYGYYYNWIATVREPIPMGVNPGDVQGVCPTGWHVPNVEEWIQLKHYVMSQSQYTGTTAMALASSEGWGSCSTYGTPGYNPSANNSTGFTALPAGRKKPSATTMGDSGIGTDAFFWTNTLYTHFNDHAKYFWLNNNLTDAVITAVDYYDIRCGFSVRCVRY